MASKPAILGVLAVLLASCGAPEPVERATEPRERTERRESAFDPLTSTIERAQGVQQTLDEQATEQRRRIEAAER